MTKSICNLEEKFYVDDGCHKPDEAVPVDDFPGSFQSKSFLAGARCCKVETGGNVECVNLIHCVNEPLVTYDVAASKCEAEPGYERLCTKDELLSDICCGKGGQCNHHPVWTSTSGNY